MKFYAAFIHIKKEFPSGDYYYILRIKGDKSDPGWSYIPHGLPRA